MSKYNVIIIDDERLARDEIKRHLENYPDFVIAGQAADADEAEILINTINPDLVFLDIQMPGRSGFDLLESLNNVPNIIFTTAFNQYAVQAFEVNAIDYLVKPIRAERFVKAINHLLSRFHEKENPVKSVSPDHTFFVKEAGKMYFIKPKEIYLIESIGNYVRLHFGNEKVHMKRSLKQMEGVLDASFFRVSRTELINTNYIEQILTEPNGRLIIKMLTGKNVTASTRQSALFKARHGITFNN